MPTRFIGSADALFKSMNCMRHQWLQTPVSRATHPVAGTKVCRSFSKRFAPCLRCTRRGANWPQCKTLLPPHSHLQSPTARCLIELVSQIIREARVRCQCQSIRYRGPAYSRQHDVCSLVRARVPLSPTFGQQVHKRCSCHEHGGFQGQPAAVPARHRCRSHQRGCLDGSVCGCG